MTHSQYRQPGSVSTSLGFLGDTTTASISTGSTLASSALTLASTTAAIPVAGAIIAAGAALASFIGYLVANSGCGQTCIVSSDEANKIEPLLQQNLNAYLSSPRTAQDQAAALQNFDAAWGALVQFCSNPQLGDAGKNCIADRQSGSCKWRDDSGACWNWFTGYRDPIANDVVNPSPVGSGAVTDLLSNLSGSIAGISPVLLIGGGLILILALGGGEGSHSYHGRKN